MCLETAHGKSLQTLAETSREDRPNKKKVGLLRPLVAKEVTLPPASGAETSETMRAGGIPCQLGVSSGLILLNVFTNSPKQEFKS